MPSKNGYDRKPASEFAYVRAKRRCLSCGREFDSTHAGNRICSNCRATELFTSPSFATRQCR